MLRRWGAPQPGSSAHAPQSLAEILSTLVSQAEGPEPMSEVRCRAEATSKPLGADDSTLQLPVSQRLSLRHL